MAEPENPQPPIPDQPAPDPAAEEEKERSWLPMAIGTGLVVVVLLAVTVIARMGQTKQKAPDSYLTKLEIGGLHMATAENFAGGSVTYILGRIANTGDKKVTSARVQIIFRNSIGEVSQKEVVPVTVLLPNIPYQDYGSLDRAPLAPGQLRDFRLTLEYVTTDWDGQVPQIKVVAVGY
jgi:hypothetical protein